MTPMRSGTTLEQGDGVLVRFPFSDLSSAKQRPALVLSKATYNGASEDVILCAMTSNLANAAHSVYVDAPDLAQGRLAAPSRIKVDKLFTAERSIVQKVVARVKPALVAQV